MVQVTMRDDDQIEVAAPQQGKVRCRTAPRLLRVQPAIDKQVEVADLNEQRIGANAAIAVQVD